MAKKDLKYFMRNAEPEVVTMPGPDTFRDENGEVIQFEIRVLSQSEILKINNMYKRRSVAMDKRGNPMVANGEVVWKTERDNTRATRHIIAEALQYPNLKDPALMEHYHCVDVTEMPLLVFSRSDEYTHVNRIVMAALGIGEYTVEDRETIEEAKN